MKKNNISITEIILAIIAFLLAIQNDPKKGLLENWNWIVAIFLFIIIVFIKIGFINILCKKTKKSLMKFNFLWSIFEIIANNEPRKLLSEINRKKTIDKSAQIKSLLKEYLKEEELDIKSQTIVTTFTNYAKLVKSLVEYNKSIYSGQKIICISQNTMDFVKWFNLRLFWSDKDWVEYLKKMHKFKQDEDITLYRYMAFTTKEIKDQVSSKFGIDHKSIPFTTIDFNNGLNVNVNDILKEYKNKYSNVFLTSNKTQNNGFLSLGHIISENDFFNKYLLIPEDQLGVNQNTKRILGNKFPTTVKSPAFNIADSKITYNNNASTDLVNAMKILFNPEQTLFALYLDESAISAYYDEKSMNIAEDFFAIGIENDQNIDWQIVLAAKMDKRIDTVKLKFVTKDLSISTNPSTQKTEVTWHDTIKYIEDLHNGTNVNKLRL